jgi:hypothetical protein
MGGDEGTGESIADGEVHGEVIDEEDNYGTPPHAAEFSWGDGEKPVPSDDYGEEYSAIVTGSLGILVCEDQWGRMVVGKLQSSKYPFAVGDIIIEVGYKRWIWCMSNKLLFN